MTKVCVLVGARIFPFTIKSLHPEHEADHLPALVPRYTLMTLPL
jgi:hypothetical protein